MGQKNSSQRQGKAIKPTKPSQRILEYLHFYIYIYIYIIFYYFKCYFIYYTISFYNISNIPTFILKYNTLKYYKLYYKVINKFSISLHFLIFVIACLWLSQQPNNPITTMPTTPPLPTTHQNPTGTKNLNKKKKKKKPHPKPNKPIRKKNQTTQSPPPIPPHHRRAPHATTTHCPPKSHQNQKPKKKPYQIPTKNPANS